MSACNQLPPTGRIVFDNIVLSYENQVVANPTWSVQPFQPVCSANAEVLSANSLALTWDPNGSPNAGAAATEDAAEPRHRKWKSAFRRRQAPRKAAEEQA